MILESGFIGVNLSGFLVDKFKRLKLVALFCVTMCEYIYQKIIFDKNVFLNLLFSALISYGIVIYVITLKKVWIVMVVVPGTDQTVRFRRWIPDSKTESHLREMSERNDSKCTGNPRTILVPSKFRSCFVLVPYF